MHTNINNNKHFSRDLPTLNMDSTFAGPKYWVVLHKTASMADRNNANDRARLHDLIFNKIPSTFPCPVCRGHWNESRVTWEKYGVEWLIDNGVHVDDRPHVFSNVKETEERIHADYAYQLYLRHNVVSAHGMAPNAEYKNTGKMLSHKEFVRVSSEQGYDVLSEAHDGSLHILFDQVAYMFIMSTWVATTLRNFDRGVDLISLVRTAHEYVSWFQDTIAPLAAAEDAESEQNCKRQKTCASGADHENHSSPYPLDRVAAAKAGLDPDSIPSKFMPKFIYKKVVNAFYPGTFATSDDSSDSGNQIVRSMERDFSIHRVTAKNHIVWEKGGPMTTQIKPVVKSCGGLSAQ